MKLDGFFGPSYQESSLLFDAQRTVNFFPVVDETGKGKEPYALFGTPGLLSFSATGAGPIRGHFTSTNGRMFVVANTDFCEISAAGAVTVWGAIGTEGTICTLDENFTQLAICDGTDVYIFTYATNAFAQVVDTDFPDGGTITQLDGYFIVNKPDSGEFYISALQDGTSWNPLDFATAESSSDKLVRVLGALGQLWLIGDITTEIWYNSGNVDFPFTRVQGAKMEVGAAAAHSVISIDNSVFWLGKTREGQGMVYRATGYSPQRISTHAIEEAISRSMDLTDIRAWAYQKDGHVFYALTGGNLETTLVYDVSTGMWHERAYLEEDGTYGQHRAVTCTYAFGKHLVGDRVDGTLYEMSLDYYDDDGDPIKAQRTFTHLYDESKPFRMNEIQVDFEYGVGLNDEDEPLVWLEISEDGARTWSPEYQATIGAIGEYKTRAVWRRMGRANRTGQVTIRASISDPVKRVITGAYLK